MESLAPLLLLLEPAPLALVVTAVLVVLSAAHRALLHEKEAERHKETLESSITLSGRQAMLVPFVSSLSLLLMFYLFPSISHLITAFTALAAASSLIFALSPVAVHLGTAWGGGADAPLLYAQGSGGPGARRAQLLLTACSAVIVLSWLLSGHWVLNNILGVAICVAFVSHVKLPNIKVCALLLFCLFLYDIFWVFFSERFFGANVMVTVATQKAHNPVHSVAQQLRLPASESITKKLDLPVKLLFPRDLFLFHSDPLPGPLELTPNATATSGGNSAAANEPSMDFMMLGLGDMAIPGMLMALVLCFEHRRNKGCPDDSTGSSSSLWGPGKGSPYQYRYVWWATWGYAAGLLAALAAGVLTRAPQPALLYLVPSTLGPVAAIAWANKELGELWNGNTRKQFYAEKGKERGGVS